MERTMNSWPTTALYHDVMGREQWSFQSLAIDRAEAMT